jgi:hypothetical protein
VYHHPFSCITTPFSFVYFFAKVRRKMQVCIRLLVAAILCFSFALAGRHSAAEIFNGALAYVNTTTLVNGVWVNTGVGKIGNIAYSPAFQGALYGNVTVAYGNVLDSSVSCTTALESYSSYTGGYQVFPELGYVEHYPYVRSNPINGATPINVVGRRYYTTYEDDNLVVLGQNPTASRLHWRRNFPFPAAGSACTFTISVSPSGSSWVSGGYSWQQYSLTITNSGEQTITFARIALNLGGGSEISSSWNIAHAGQNLYTVSLPAGLAVGQSSSSAGFIARGSGIVTVSADLSGSVCN